MPREPSDGSSLHNNGAGSRVRMRRGAGLEVQRGGESVQLFQERGRVNGHEEGFQAVPRQVIAVPVSSHIQQVQPQSRQRAG